MRQRRAPVRSIVVVGMLSCLLPASLSAQEAPLAWPGGLAAAGGPSFGPAEKRSDTYGTTNLSFYRVGLSEFSPTQSSITYSDAFTPITALSRHPTANGNLPFVAVPHLPSGAIVEEVEFDWCDTSDSVDEHFAVYRNSFTGDDPHLIGTADSSGSVACAYSVATLNPVFVADNNVNQLVLFAYALTTDGTTGISGAIVRYRLQVSPPPATATFNDVPTSHPFFQYIEALAASGITGGCQASPPLYCPSSPVTRGQMAVFLAKALGLAFQ